MKRALSVAAGVLLALAGAEATRAAAAPPGFVRVETGPAGGTLWQGVLPGTARGRPSAIYLPPRFSPAARYPVVYLLHGMPGSPYSFVVSLRIAAVADRLIASERVRPFIAVMPVAGPTGRYDGEWTGRWERYVVEDVVPWVDAHLPTIDAPADRALAGLSAGGFGAVDIGLRHPGLFGTLESWSGYFTAPHDGTLARTTLSALDRHDPTLLAAQEAPLLRSDGTRFFLSSGTTTDRRTAAATRLFAQELARLRLPYRLWLAPGGHDDRFWRAQLPAALAYGVGQGSAVRTATPGGEAAAVAIARAGPARR